MAKKNALVYDYSDDFVPVLKKMAGVDKRPHIHEKIDFTVSIFIAQDQKVLFVFAIKQLQRWLPIGGHIELDEHPEQAAIREAKEESGLNVELYR